MCVGDESKRGDWHILLCCNVSEERHRAFMDQERDDVAPEGHIHDQIPELRNFVSRFFQ